MYEDLQSKGYDEELLREEMQNEAIFYANKPKNLWKVPRGGVLGKDYQQGNRRKYWRGRLRNMNAWGVVVLMLGRLARVLRVIKKNCQMKKYEKIQSLYLK